MRLGSDVGKGKGRARTLGKIASQSRHGSADSLRVLFSHQSILCPERWLDECKDHHYDYRPISMTTCAYRGRSERTGEWVTVMDRGSAFGKVICQSKWKMQMYRTKERKDNGATPRQGK